jgi:hypothetical protein
MVSGEQSTISADLVADLWRTVKDARDEAIHLGRDRLASELDCLLARMKRQGMAGHLPSIEEIRGLHLPTIEEIRGLWANV